MTTPRLRSAKTVDEIHDAIKDVLLKKLMEYEEDIVLDPAPKGELRFRLKTSWFRFVRIKITSKAG